MKSVCSIIKDVERIIDRSPSIFFFFNKNSTYTFFWGGYWDDTGLRSPYPRAIENGKNIVYYRHESLSYDNILFSVVWCI